jgi:hypothetical protein
VHRKCFWDIIDAARKRAAGDQAAQYAALEELLRLLSPDEIALFDAHFTDCMGRADCNEIYAAASIIDGYGLSDDAFTYFLEWLIAQGKAVFEKAIHNPDSLADAVDKGRVCALEGFGYIPTRVWEEKTGLCADEMPGQKATEAKAPSGPAWKDDDDLRQRFPRLWVKFIEEAK